MRSKTSIVSRRSAILGAAVSLLAAPARACGYDNPDDFAQYLINIRYPKAMYVRAAVAEAEELGLLPPGAAQKPGPDPFAFLRTAALLKELGTRLAPLRAPHGQAGFSLVLLESALWTRYAQVGERYDTSVHVHEAKPGEAVVVTEACVLTALLRGTLTFTGAAKAELLRPYGSDNARAAIHAAFAGFV